MNLISVSNIFNALTQLHKLNSQLDRPLQFYHSGTIEDFNQSGIDNNFDKGNETGKNYPLLIFPYDASGEFTAVNNRIIPNNMSIDLVFADTMFYDNDSKGDTRTEVEVANNLMAIAMEFLRGLQKVNGQELLGDKCNGLSIIGGVKYKIIPFFGNDRLMVLWCEFVLNWKEECGTFTPNFAELPTETPVPVSDIRDYENYKNIQD